MVNRCGRYVIYFNGEIYNFAALRDQLGLDPARLRSTSDTEVLLGAWAALGSEILPQLVGQFAFAVWCPANDGRAA